MRRDHSNALFAATVQSFVMKISAGWALLGWSLAPRSITSCSGNELSVTNLQVEFATGCLALRRTSFLRNTAQPVRLPRRLGGRFLPDLPFSLVLGRVSRC